MTSDGTPWRPIVHVRDICQAIALRARGATRGSCTDEIFNVGDTDGQLPGARDRRDRRRRLPRLRADVRRDGGDNRSYRVSFDKIHAELPGFECDWDVRAGVDELRDVFERIGLDEMMFEFRGYTRLKQIRYLLDTGRIEPARVLLAAAANSADPLNRRCDSWRCGRSNADVHRTDSIVT